MRPSLKLICLVGGAAIVLAAGAALWRAHRANTQNAKAPTSLSGRPAHTARLPANVEAPTRMPGRPGKTTFSAENASLPAGMERVRLIVNPDHNVGFRERVAAIRALKTKLTAAEVSAFSVYLLTPTPQSGQNRESENWLRNEMLDKLVQQAAMPPGLSDLLVAIYHDPAQDVVMRDYAVQHMAPAYERVGDQEKANLRDALWQATGETDTSIAGTALLALLDVVGGSRSVATAVVASAVSADSGTDNRLKTGDATIIGRARLTQAAFNLAADDRCGELARITAVQVCGRMQIEQALPVVEHLAQEAPSIPLRIAATAALGDIGGTEAVQLLQRLAESPEPRQALAAQSALRRADRAQAKHSPNKQDTDSHAESFQKDGQPHETSDSM